MFAQLQQHRQLLPTSCAASGMEAILKLHELIPPNSFPYQDQFGGQNIGFEKISLLADHGLLAKDSMLELEGAISLLQQETDGGRFPLVSLLTVVNGTPIGWHIYVAAKDESELLLIDPAPSGGDTYAKSIPAVRSALRHTLDAVSDRPTIHILTYSLAPMLNDS